MLALLIAASLLSVSGEPPAHAKAAAKQEEPAAPEESAKSTHRKPPPPSVPAEEPEKAVAAPKPVVRRAPKRVAPAVPAAAVAPPATDVRAARLEAENAKLRQQLALTGAVPAPPAIADAGAALLELKAGNQRFVDGARVRTLLSSDDPGLRQTLARGQAPFAVIITCSDSRLGDNFIFDQELGRLFTIREAGNSPDTQSLASVEYAVEHLGSKIVVVMGHEGCGAVKAVAEANGRPLPGNLWSLQAAMSGLLESTPAEPNESTESHMHHLALHNAERQAQAVLDRSEMVRELVTKGKVKVVPALYDLASGKVTFLAEPARGHGEAAHH